MISKGLFESFAAPRAPATRPTIEDASVTESMPRFFERRRGPRRDVNALPSTRTIRAQRGASRRFRLRVRIASPEALREPARPGQRKLVVAGKVIMLMF